ncbi:H-NS family nucleoid-associated regulatory protein [Burkholderia stagnalis]|uniref:H-NS histone family protein n=1 Tax=Burkholderia stagnalis TaxID=1503054 RepID=UPI000F8030D8|nr:H-NS histone family protein [Burkholderia stagnalis]
MPTYQELKAKVRALQAEAELARKNEVQGAIKEIQRLIGEFELKPEDLFADSQLRSRRVKRRGPAIAKYRDPVSGAVWSGRGREPRWIAGHDRQKFLIHALS